MGAPKVSIIIRSKNEEEWISHCLQAVEQQNFKSYEIIVVDSGSDDTTLQVVESRGVSCIVNLEQFRPGLALNRGIEVSRGEFLVILSAHCIPKIANWLE